MADILDQMTGSADYLSGADTTPHRIVPSSDGTHPQTISDKDFITSYLIESLVI